MRERFSCRGSEATASAKCSTRSSVAPSRPLYWPGSALLGSLGLIAAVWADKYEQIAAFQNFIIMPLTFLSGVFYSIHSLPPFWQQLSHLNPFFYMIDGFRYGFFGVSDINPAVSLGIVCASLAALIWLALVMLRSGYKLRG